MKPRGMPKAIRVGYVDYKVVSWPRDLAEAASALGIHEYYTETIRIREGLSPKRSAEVLLHEVLHACWRNVALTGDVEESAVSVLSDNLSQVWRDNPALIDWISASLRS